MKKTIAIIYPFFPIYREGLFKILSNKSPDSIIQFVFFADDCEVKGIRNISNGDAIRINMNWVKTKTFKSFIKDKFVLFWQTKVLSICINKEYKSLIFLGDPLHLSTWVFCIIGKIFNKQIIFWTHGLYGREGKFVRKMKIIFFKLADNLLLYSELSKREFIKANFNPESLFVIGNSLDFELQSKVKSNITEKDIEQFKLKTFKDSKTPIITFIGRLEKSKRIDLLISAINILFNNRINVNCLIIGDGPEKSTLTKQVQNLGLNNVYFLGKAYNEEEVAIILSSSDLTVSPGNVGLNCIHSLTYGTPVITHDNFFYQGPEFESIISEINGEFFKENDIEDLALKIQKWIYKKNTDFKIRDNCEKIVIEKYNPQAQKNLIYKALNIE